MGRIHNRLDEARIIAACLIEYGDGMTVPCVWCGITLSPFYGLGAAPTLDHVEPQSVGKALRGKADNSRANIMLACVGCNVDRGDATDAPWSDADRLYAHNSSIPAAPRALIERVEVAGIERRERERAARDAHRATVRTQQRESAGKATV